MSDPWLPTEFLEMFDSWDTQDWRMFEFGAGGSTAWFAQRVDRLWSIEHNRSWFKKTKVMIEGLDNVELVHRGNFDEYVSYIDNFDDNFFDCILVDGRERVRCVKHSLGKFSRYLVLDNARRDRYEEARNLLSDYKVSEAVWREDLDGEPGNPTSNTLIYERV